MDIISDVREWLRDAGVIVSRRSSSGRDNPSGNELLILELSGKPVAGLAEKYGTDGCLLLRWLLPRFSDGACKVTDLLSGESYSSGYVFRLPEFDRDKRGDISPLNLCPNLDRGRVIPAWYRDVEYKWKRFADSIKKNPKRVCSLDSFVKLEAGLNAHFTSSKARAAGRFTKDFGQECNPLLSLENSRQVLIDWPTETLGRLRIPHKSHKNKLCPFQTPESKRIGLQLNLSAGTQVSNGTITEGNELFSVATGLIPYPHHTDGPRLMMGGKNMKQAESGITGAEPPIVPGYYEGIYASDIPGLRAHMKDKRFFPYLGLNALTVIMPFKGYTYEDGLVISESLASRLCIKNGSYRQSKTFEVVIRSQELSEKGLSGVGDVFKTAAGERFVYGDLLPYPAVNLYSKDTPEKIASWHERYGHHAPGVLQTVSVRYVITKQSGSKSEKVCTVEFIVSWDFRVERPMYVGDKLTGRNGNKGVVTKILPDEEMPKIHFADVTLPAELIISPCSILGRKNLGQIWEMAHSLLIMKGGAKLQALLGETGLDLKNIRLDGMNDLVNADNIRRITDGLQEFLSETGCDESGTFTVTFGGKSVRAFAGWQYFCRLHHHAWKKLQARGRYAPYDSIMGQPSRCGALSGQRLGEMENWAFLSHGAGEVLSAMRKKHNGDYGKTRGLLRKVLRCLGIVVEENDSGVHFKAGGDDDNGLERKILWNILSADSMDGAFCAVMKKGNTPAEGMTPLNIAKELREKLSGSDDARKNKAVKALDAMIEDECFFNPDGSIHIEPTVMDYSAELDTAIRDEGSVISLKAPSLKKLLQVFCRENNPLLRAEALIGYRDGLIGILSGKTGIPRCYMAGRRYNHSGRAVIVPEPSLYPDTVYLPAAMLVELLDGYDESYIASMPLELRNFPGMRRILSDYFSRKTEAEELARKLDDFLSLPFGELWCFLIRQPSLHRNSVQAFKIRCWALPVIGLPPMVTPGFNADFDGDTMAVFLPPYEHAQNLSRYSVLSNPGIIGNGKPALADSLDLALGWQNMNPGGKLSSHLAELLRTTPPDRMREELRRLQLDVAENSSGAATLTPVEFERLSDDDDSFGYGLTHIVNSGAKGSHDDVAKMVKELGKVDKMKDDDESAKDTETADISGNFWHGLSDDELFTYSYPSRYSIAQKKLSVADAGYLSRLIAEKLFNYNSKR